jgi:hypothetical protein
VAWVLGLITFPYVAVPAYWVFGRSKFRGFVALRRADLVKTVPAARRYLDELKTGQLIAFPERQRELSIEKLAKLPFTVGNDVELLVDGRTPSIRSSRGSSALSAIFWSNFTSCGAMDWASQLNRSIGGQGPPGGSGVCALRRDRQPRSSGHLCV